MITAFKKFAISLLEKHPYGYALGLAIMESSSIFLPHENDFYAMPLIASPSFKGLFLDIGANRGHSALGFTKIMPNWNVISFEANPIHKNRLQKLKNKEKLLDYHIVAANDVSGISVTIWTPKFRSIDCHSSAAIDRHEAVRAIEMSFPSQAKYFNYVANEVKTLALDDLNLNPHIIKIDIQGKEIACLRGLHKTIEKCQPIFLIECNLDGNNIIQFMKEINYIPYIYLRNEHKIIKAPEKLEFKNERNVFFIPHTLKDILS